MLRAIMAESLPVFDHSKKYLTFRRMSFSNNDYREYRWGPDRIYDDKICTYIVSTVTACNGYY
jgi:hypothetical protein